MSYQGGGGGSYFSVHGGGGGGGDGSSDNHPVPPFYVAQSPSRNPQAPNFPRPSPQSANMLRSRLVMGSKKKMKNATLGGGGGEDSVDEGSLASDGRQGRRGGHFGYGEDEFDNSLADESAFENNASFFNSQTSIMHHGGSNTLMGTIANKSAASSMTSKSTYRFKNTAMSQGSVLDNSLLEESIVKYSHASIKEVIDKEGYSTAANNIADGITEFGYLKTEKPMSMELQFTGVPYNTNNSTNYLTLSKFGILDNKAGIMYSLQEYMQTAKTLNTVKDINVIKNYKKYKYFIMWKRHLTGRKRELSSTVLQQQWYCDSILWHVYSKISPKLVELSKLVLLKIDVEKFYDTESFSSLQKSLQTAAKANKKEILASIIENLVVSGEKYISSKIHDMPLLYQKVGDTAAPDFTAMSSSMTDHLGTKIISFTEKGAIRTNTRKMGDFVRVIDFIIRDWVYYCVEMQLENFVRVCDRPERKRYYQDKPQHMYHTVTETSHLAPSSNTKGLKAFHGIMKFRIILEDDPMKDDNDTKKYSIGMTPSRFDVIRELSNILHETLVFGCYTDSILHHPTCRSLFQPIYGELEGFLLNDKIFMDKDNSVHTLCKILVDFFEKDFDNASSLLDQYSKVCAINSLNNKFIKVLIGNIRLPVVQYKADLDRLNEELAFVESIPVNIDVGVLRLDLSSLKKSVFETVIRARSALTRNIPAVYLEYSEKLYLELSGVKGALSSKTMSSNLDEFVKVVDIYQLALKNAEATKDEYEYIKAVKDIIDSYELSKVETINSQHNALLSFWFSYNEALTSFTETLDAKTKEFHHEMTGRAKSLIEPCDSTRAFIASEKINNFDSDPEEILKEISVLRRNMVTIKAKMAVLDRYQLTLKIHVFNYSPILELIDSLEYCQSLWEMIFSIRNLCEVLYSTNFVDVKLTEYEKKITALAKSFNSKVLPDRGILVEWIESEIDKLTTFMPILHNLLSPTLRPPHKARLVELFKREIYDEENFLLQYLVDLNCFALKDKIDTIFNEALCESNIELNLQQLKEFSSKLEFILDTDRENKTIYVIQNLEEIKEGLEHIRLSIISNMQSVYSANYSDTLIDFLEDIKVWQTATDNVATLQECYLRARILFTSARTARYVNSGVKNFKVIDEAWRFVSRNIKQLGRLGETLNVDGFMPAVEDTLPFVEKTYVQLDGYISEQRDSFPKLNLIDRDLLIDIFCTFDPQKTFYKCCAMCPALTDVGFDEADSFSTISLSSGFEKVELLKAVSARSSLTDWLRAIEMGLSDRLIGDLKDILYDPSVFLERFSSSKFLNQSRICYLQIKFWNNLFDHIGKDGVVPPKYDGEEVKKLLEAECVNEIEAISSLLSSSTSRYEVIVVSNMLIQCVYHRDLLEKIFESEDNPLRTFTLDSLIKKFWNPSNSSIRVKQLEFNQTYGMKYQAFSSRLVITPLTERFFLALNSSFLSHSAPCVFGDALGGKQNSIRALVYEYGMEYCAFPANSLTKDRIIDLMKVSMGSGMWLLFSDISKVDNSVLSFLLTTLSISLNVLRSKVPTYSLFGQTVRSLKSDKFQAKFFLTFNGSFNLFKTYACFLEAFQNQFRPLAFPPIESSIVINTLLLVYDYQSYSKLAVRLDAFCKHVSILGIISQNYCLKLLCNAIKEVGFQIHSTEKSRRKSDHQKCLGLIFNEILSKLPSDLHDKFPITSKQSSSSSSSSSNNRERTKSKDDASGDYSKPSRLNTISELNRFKECVDLFTDSDRETNDNLLLLTNSLLLKESKHHILSENLQQYLSRSAEDSFDPSRESFEFESCEETLLVTLCVEPVVITSFFEPLSVIVVGDQGVGKSSMIDKVTGIAKSFYEDRVRRLHEANKVTIIYKQFLTNPNTMYPSSFIESDKGLGYFRSLLLKLNSNDFSLLKFDVNDLSDGIRWFKQQARNLSRSVTGVWECLSLRNIDPSIIADHHVVYVKAPSCDLKTSLNAQVAKICQRDGFTLRDLLSNCMDSIFSRFLDFSFQQNNFPTEITARNCLHIFGMVYESSGLTTSLGASKWNEVCAKRIFVFACIWSFGMSPNLNKAAFKSWFMSPAGFEEELKARNPAFPAISSESSNSIYAASVLFRPDVDENILHWKVDSVSKLRSSPSPNWFNDCHLSLYSDFYSSRDRVIVPIPELQAISFIRDCYAGFENNSNVSNMVRGGFTIVGEKGSSKTSLLQYLLNKTAQPRWILSASCKDRRSIESGVQIAINRALPRLCENKIKEEGCLFIDDVSISPPNSHGESASGFEYLREILSNKNKSVFNSSTDKFDKFNVLQVFMALKSNYSASNRNDAAVYARLMMHTLIFSLNTDNDSITSIFALVIENKHSNILDHVLIGDITKLTTNLVSGLMNDAKLFALDTCNHTIFTLKFNGYVSFLSQIFGNFSAALLNLASISSGDIIRVWDRVFSNLMITSNSIAASIMGISTNTFSEVNFQTPIFVAAADREIQKYSSDVEFPDSSIYNMQYSKSGGGFDINVFSLDYLRETVMITCKKNSALYSLLAGKIDTESDFFWEDLHSLASVILTKNLNNKFASAIISTENHDILCSQLELISNSFNLSIYSPSVESLNELKSSVKSRFLSYVLSQPDVEEFLESSGISINTSCKYAKIDIAELEQHRYVFYLEVQNSELFNTVNNLTAEIDSIANLNSISILDFIDSFDNSSDRRNKLVSVLVNAIERVKEKITLLITFKLGKTLETFGQHFLVNEYSHAHPLRFLRQNNVYIKSMHRFTKAIGEATFKRICDTVDVASELFTQFSGRPADDSVVSQEYRDQTVNSVLCFYKYFETLHKQEDAKSKFIEIVKKLVPAEESFSESIWPAVASVRGQANIPLLIYSIACAVYSRYFYITRDNSLKFNSFVSAVMEKCQEFYATAIYPSILLAVQRGILSVLSTYGECFDILEENNSIALRDMQHVLNFVDKNAMSSHFLTSFLLALFIGNVNLTDHSLITTHILVEIFKFKSISSLEIDMGGHQSTIRMRKDISTLVYNTNTNFYFPAQTVLTTELFSLYLLLSGFICNFPVAFSKTAVFAIWNAHSIANSGVGRELLMWSLFAESRIDNIRALYQVNIPALETAPEASQTSYIEFMYELVNALEPSLLCLAVLMKSIQGSSSSNSKIIQLLWSSFIGGIQKLFELAEIEPKPPQFEIKDFVANSFNLILKSASSLFPLFTYNNIVIESVLRLQLDQSIESRSLLKVLMDQLYQNSGLRGILEIPKTKKIDNGKPSKNRGSVVGDLKEADNEDDDDHEDKPEKAETSVRLMLSESSRTTIMNLLSAANAFNLIKPSINPILSSTLTSQAPAKIITLLESNLMILAEWISDIKSEFPDKMKMEPLEALITFIELKPVFAARYAHALLSNVLGDFNAFPAFIDLMVEELAVPRDSVQGSMVLNKNSSLALYPELNSSDYQISFFTDFTSKEDEQDEHYSVNSVYSCLKALKMSHDEKHDQSLDGFHNNKPVVMQCALSQGSTFATTASAPTTAKVISASSSFDSQNDNRISFISFERDVKHLKKCFVANGFSFEEGLGVRISSLFSLVSTYFSNRFDNYYSPLLCRISWLVIFSHVAVSIRLREYCKFNASLVTSSLRTIKSLIISKVKEVDYSDDVSEIMSPEYIVDTIVNSYYCYSCYPELSSMIKSIFSSFFTTSSFIVKEDYNYTIGGKYILPKSFRDSEGIRAFVAALEKESQNEAFIADLYGSSASITNSNLYKGLGFENVRNKLQRPFMSWFRGSDRGPMPLMAIISTICSKLNSLIVLLPKLVPINEENIRAYSQDFMTENNSKSKSKSKFKKGQNFNGKKSKEVNPIIEYVLMESLEFNEVLTALRSKLTKYSNVKTLYDFLYNLMMQDKQSMLNVLQWCNEISSGIFTLAGNSWQTLAFGGGFVEDQNMLRISIDEWINMLAEKSRMLTSWLNDGYPPALRIHLFSNPFGLLHSIKESFAMQTGSGLETLSFDATMIDPKLLGEVDFKHFNVLNHGCNIVVTDIKLRNGIFDHANYEMSFPTYLNCSEHYQEIALQLAVTPSSSSDDFDDDFSCPFHILSNIPTNPIDPSVCDPEMKQTRAYKIMNIQLPVTEDSGDCDMRGVLLLASPKWFSSVNISEL